MEETDIKRERQITILQKFANQYMVDFFGQYFISEHLDANALKRRNNLYIEMEIIEQLHDVIDRIKENTHNCINDLNFDNIDKISHYLVNSEIDFIQYVQNMPIICDICQILSIGDGSSADEPLTNKFESMDFETKFMSLMVELLKLE